MIGRGILDEVRRHEDALSLQDVLSPSRKVLEHGTFRVSHVDGLLYETSLVGGWHRDMDRLIEFDRPTGVVVRQYDEPTMFRRRERKLRLKDGGRRASIVLDEIRARWSDYVVAEVLKATGASNLRKMEESVSVDRFLQSISWLDPRAQGEMVRYGVSIEVERGELGGEVKPCAALAETAFDNAVDALLAGGWTVVMKRDALLEAHPLAAEVRKVSGGIGACTWWDDGTCREFAELLESEGVEDVAFRRMVIATRRGERRDRLAEFVESKSYPREQMP